MNTDSLSIRINKVKNRFKTSNIGKSTIGLSEVSDFAELAASIPSALLLFGPLTKIPDDIVIFLEGDKRRFMVNKDLCDIPVAYGGIAGAIPFIFNDKNPEQSTCGTGFGTTQYKAREKDIYYIQMSFRKSHYDQKFLVMLKEDVEKVFKHFDHQNDALDRLLLVDRPPLLANGLMEDLIKNSIEFLENHEKFAHYGTRPARGLIFRGDPGNGKTMASKWIQVIAKRKGLFVESFTGSDIDSYYMDNAMTSMMNSANILFFDDIDISFLSRRKGAQSDSKKACALLSAMDGISDVKKGVVRIFTTNESVSDIDPAFLRPGRIDKVFNFENPTIELRNQVISNYWHKDIVNAINVDYLLKKTNGITFSDLEEIKTLLVQGFIHDGGWDLEKSLKDFNLRKEMDTKEKAKPKKKKT